MDLMAMKSQSEERLQALKRRFADIYKKRTVNDRICFLRSDGSLFSLSSIPTFGAFVVEYADNLEEAKLNRFEDGDLFYLEEMDEETMFQSMIREVEQ